MSYNVAGIVFALAAVDWLAVWKGWKWLEYLAKPGVILVLLAWLVVEGGLNGPLLWFELGLLFSLFADIFLMLPKDRFMAGLVFFLLAHLTYILGFNPTPPPVNLASLALVALVGGTSLQLYRSIAAGMPARGLSKLKIPVLLYTIFLGAMLLSALLTLVRPDDEWRPLPALLASAGALLFYISDGVLAWNKCVADLPNYRLKVMVTYHLGQIGIIAGAALNFL